MGNVKLLLALGLFTVVRAQQPLYAYAPGAGLQGVQYQQPQQLPSYRPTPRLVPVNTKVNDNDSDRELLQPAEGRNIRITPKPPLYLTSQQEQEPYPYPYNGYGGRVPRAEAYQYPQATTPITRPRPLSYTYVQQPTEVKRIRVNSQGVATSQLGPGLYAATPSAQPIQYSQQIPHYKSVVAQAPQVVQYASPIAQYYPQQQQIHRPITVSKVPVASPAVRQLVKVAQRPGGKLAAQEEEAEEYPSDPNPQYNFAFDVKDDDFTNYQNRQEQRDGGVIKGSYSVVDPDGYVRTVTYEASPKGGFQAKVTREPTDVKIKFPVPSPAPKEGEKAGPIQYLTNQQAQAQYAAQGTQAYVPRRYPHRLAITPQYAQ